MVREVLEVLGPRDGGLYLDATVGTAGHAAALLDSSGPSGRLVGVDRDEDALDVAAEHLTRFPRARWSLHHGSFSRLVDVLGEAGEESFDGVLADLGLSTLQLEDAGRGFSFRLGGPLDMRMDRSEPGTALDVLRGSSVNGLERILRQYGEERRAARVARRIHRAVREGRVGDTRDLAREIREAVGSSRSGAVDSATRTFQAVRMAVNREVDELEALLCDVMGLLRPGGVFVCLTYHSIEDRMVKRALRDGAAGGRGEVMTPRPITAGRVEVRQNRRSRSAKLRAFRRSAGEGS